MYDVWCMMYDVWCMMYDVWCMMYDVWSMTPVFRENPPPPLKLNLNGNYPYYPSYLQFFKRPHPHSVIILWPWSTIWVSILIKSIVLSLFLAFITLSDLYYPHHPPSEGCTFRSRKKGILYLQGSGSFLSRLKAFYDVNYTKIIICSSLVIFVLHFSKRFTTIPLSILYFWYTSWYGGKGKRKENCVTFYLSSLWIKNGNMYDI